LAPFFTCVFIVYIQPCWSQAGGGPFLGIPAQVAAAGGGSFSPFYSTASGPAGLLPVLPPDPSGASQLTVVGPQGVGQKMPRSDRLEVSLCDIYSSLYLHIFHNLVCCIHYYFMQLGYIIEIHILKIAHC
jgi:hypothetical protein